MRYICVPRYNITMYKIWKIAVLVAKFNIQRMTDVLEIFFAENG